jgi:ADP-ribosylglycohydrolase
MNGTINDIMNKMLGALVGDIIGSVYEFNNTKTTDFELFTPESRFTDDSVMTLAVAKWLMVDEAHKPDTLIACMQELGRHYSWAGYGGHFERWLWQYNPQPYNSWGNGAGMRVSPVGLYATTLEQALGLASITASVSHNHPEGVKGAQAIAASVFLCKQGKTKAEIKSYVERTFGYDLNRTIDEIRSSYSFDVSCQGSVPESIIAFLEGNSFEEVIRLAISLGGDSDTIACMAGAIAACMYPIPEEMTERCNNILTSDLRGIEDAFISLIEKGEKRNMIEITSANYKDYTFLDIVAFSSAHPGAMGDRGAIVIMTTDGCVYHTNPYYGDISEEEAGQICPPLKDCRFGMFGGGEIPKGWQTIYMGNGNHLVIKDDISAQFFAIVEREEKQGSLFLYKKWMDIVFEIIKDNLCNIEQIQSQNERGTRDI